MERCRLCNVRFTTVKANINLKEVTVNSRTGDFNPTSLAQVINTETVNRLIVQTWLDKARKHIFTHFYIFALYILTHVVDTIDPGSENRKATLVFCVNLAHVRQLTDWYRAHGIDARYVYSGTPITERKALVNGFKAGEFPVLVNCGQGLPRPSLRPRTDTQSWL